MTAAEVIKEVIDEVFPDGQDEGLNGTEASEEETYKLPEGVVNIDIEVRNQVLLNNINFCSKLKFATESNFSDNLFRVKRGGRLFKLWRKIVKKKLNL